MVDPLALLALAIETTYNHQNCVKGALNILSRTSSGAPLKLDKHFINRDGKEETMCGALMSLHPEGKPTVDEAMYAE